VADTPENLIILSTVRQEKDEKGKDETKTQSLKAEIKKYKNLLASDRRKRGNPLSL